MTDVKSTIVEQIARQVALWHGQKMHSQVDGETRTVADLRGFQWQPDNSTAMQHAERNWREYTAVAEYILRREVALTAPMVLALPVALKEMAGAPALLNLCDGLERAVIEMQAATTAQAENQESAEAIERMDASTEAFDKIATDDNLLSIARALKLCLRTPQSVTRVAIQAAIHQGCKTAVDAAIGNPYGKTPTAEECVADAIEALLSAPAAKPDTLLAEVTAFESGVAAGKADALAIRRAALEEAARWLEETAAAAERTEFGENAPIFRSHAKAIRGLALPIPAIQDAGDEHYFPLADAEIVSAVETHGLDNAERVCFYEQDFYVLSNFSAFTLYWRGIRFDTSEAAYHYEKFCHNTPGVGRIRDAIRIAPSAHSAFKIAEQNRGERRYDWDDVKVGVMRDILRAKVQQHEYVRRKLLATGDRELVENSWRDGFWGWGPGRRGQNMLGRLWMEVRAELRAAQPKEGV